MNKAKALYIHIPFCNYICSYCDFTKLQYFSSFVSHYLDALENELKEVDNYELDTIYVGGGTPTSLNEEELERLLKMILPYTNSVKEYTFEANPDSLTYSKLILLKKYRVNRLSLGVESTSSKILNSINRHHDFNDVIRCVREAKEIGINNINIDLILGLPHVSISLLKEDIKNILSLDVNHISCYSLTVNKGTKFYLEHVQEIDDDLSRELYDMVHEELTKNGYIHYEVSNFAKEGYYSLHNLTYWKNEHYYGIGLSSSGYLDNIRYTNTKNFSKYIKGINDKEKETVSQKDEKEYFIYLNLRTIFGISFKEYQELYQEDLYKKKKEVIDELIHLGYLYIEKEYLKPTYQGMMTLDNFITKLFD